MGGDDEDKWQRNSFDAQAIPLSGVHVAQHGMDSRCGMLRWQGHQNDAEFKGTPLKEIYHGEEIEQLHHVHLPLQRLFVSPAFVASHDIQK